MHAPPLGWSGAQWPEPSQWFAGVHWLSLAQEVPHAPLDPVHRYGAQLGVPGWPDSTNVHVPSMALHTSQLPAQAVSQQ